MESTEQLVKKIGEKILSLRKRENLTLKELSEKLNVTASLLSQVEHGKAAPSLHTLQLISDYFSIPIGYLFEEIPDNKSHPVTIKGEHKKFVSKGGVVYNLLSEGAPDIEVSKINFPPNTSTGVKPYKHDGYECGYVIKGSLKVVIDDREYMVEEGGSIVFESYKDHKLINETGETVETIWGDSVPWMFRNHL